MKALFVHDHIFFEEHCGFVYSASAFPSRSWERYLLHFESLVVCGRGELIDQASKSGLVLSSHRNVKFELVAHRRSLGGRFISHINSGSKLKDLVKQTDAVIVRLPSRLGIQAISFARAFDTPYAIEVVGCAWDGLWNHGSVLGKLLAPLSYYRMRRAIYRSKHNIYVTSGFLQKRYPSNSQANVAVASNIEIEILDCKYRSLSKTVMIGLIGNFKTNYKGLDTAIEALADLSRQGLDVELHILGRGNPDAYISRAKELKVSDRVHFDGVLPNGQPVLEWLDKVDIYIQPSRQEGLPRALIEAMSRKKICIGSRAGGIPELLPREYVHDVSSSTGLANVIVRVLNLTEEQRIDIAIRNHEEALKYDKNVLEKVRYNFYSALK